MAGKDILIVASGNSLRAIVKYIERVSDDGVSKLEFPFGAVIIYDIDAEGHIIGKESRQVESKVNA
jgi:2,3-bisphosphoglycerate-dependent phosphoglycerate mutase